MTEAIHVSILGESEIIREGLRRILLDRGFVVDAFGPIVDDFSSLACDLAIVDARSLDEGLQSCQNLRERFPNMRIALMMDEYGIEDVARAFASRAVDGYLIKSISCAPLAEALRLIAVGEKVLPSQVVESLTHSDPDIAWRAREIERAWPSLSSREIEILKCLAAGDPNKIISRRLGIADATVKVHIRAILRKLKLQNRTQAAIWAANRGLKLSATPGPAMPVAHSGRSDALIRASGSG